MKTTSDLQQAVWFHAASVGEFEQVRPVIERLKRERPDIKILLTFFSPSGYEMRKAYDKADRVCYLPFATGRNAQRFLDTFRPRMAVFAKYEFWPAYLKELKKRNIPTYSVSAIFRPGQLFFRPWGGFYRRLLHCFTHIYVQDAASAELLQKHGIRHTSVAGDTRFDRVSEIALQARTVPQAEEFLQLNNPSEAVRYPVVVAGSTWPADEVLLERYLAEREDVRLILVPHEITEKHLDFIFRLFQGRYVRFTEATHQNLTMCRVLVVDTMGLLSSLYRYANVAYIGGGFGVGIHNTLEAAVYGIPVLFGPNYHKFREAKGLIAARAARAVRNYKEAEAALDEALACQEEMGANAAAYVEQERGATDKIYSEIPF